MTDTSAMMRARKIVEEHITNYGMVPHPDRLKEAIANALPSDVNELALRLARKDLIRAVEKINRALGYH